MSTRLHANMLALLKQGVASDSKKLMQDLGAIAEAKSGLNKKANMRFINKIRKLGNSTILGEVHWNKGKDYGIDVFALSIEKGGLHELSIQKITLDGNMKVAGERQMLVITVSPVVYISDHAVTQFFARTGKFQPQEIHAEIKEGFKWMPAAMMLGDIANEDAKEENERVKHKGIGVASNLGLFLGRVRTIRRVIPHLDKDGIRTVLEVKTFVAQNMFNELQADIFSYFKELDETYDVRKESLYLASDMKYLFREDKGYEDFTESPIGKLAALFYSLYNDEVFENDSGDRNAKDIETMSLKNSEKNVITAEVGSFSWQKDGGPAGLTHASILEKLKGEDGYRRHDVY